MTDRKSSSGAATGMICDIQDLEPKQEKCVAGGSERKWEIPSLQDLEEVLHSAPRSCRHGDEVWPNLFLGDMFMSHDKFGLYQLGITHVLNASHGKLCCKAEFIHQGLTSGGKVFVHCAVGVSRSAALVLAYLMIHHHLSLLSSIRCVQQKRWIFPNRGFLRQLIDLDQKLQDDGLNEPDGIRASS
ncbi:dual specificity protein phosphatase 13-like isoform X2 [Astatotilapia calliptera]|uniref:dual specificity protein phosphatase 13-like isoform X2 n=1 Tax=Astatotilapia calliptera TaxID=8154 RepID=UPI000E425F43|nr:dual specificity protein phosphatase 13-like isoform X2 [Astatotilapia calliptera]